MFHNECYTVGCIHTENIAKTQVCDNAACEMITPTCAYYK